MLPYELDRLTSPGHSHKNTQHPGQAVGQLSGCPIMWRPWALSGRNAQIKKTSTGSDRTNLKGMQGFHHPVRLYLPRSKTQEYLSHLGKKVLANFPVQATLHFYNDDSSSEEENEDGEEMEDEIQLPEKRTS